MKKFLAVLITLAMLVTLTACGENEEKGGKGKKYTDYEKLIEDVMEALEDGDKDVIAKMYTGLMLEDYAEDEAHYEIADFEHTITNEYRVRNWEIIETVVYDDDEYYEWLEEIEDYLDNLNDLMEAGEDDEHNIEENGINIDFNTSKVKNLMDVTVVINVDDEEGNEYDSTIKFVLIEERFGWKIYRMHIGDVEPSDIKVSCTISVVAGDTIILDAYPYDAIGEGDVPPSVFDAVSGVLINIGMAFEANQYGFFEAIYYNDSVYVSGIEEGNYSYFWLYDINGEGMSGRAVDIEVQPGDEIVLDYVCVIME